MKLTDLLEEFNVVIDTAEGLTELRSLILGLAVRGKLVPQDPNDEPVSILLDNIESDTQALYEEGHKMKPKKLKPVTEGEVLFSIPKSWSWVRLNSLTTYIQRGKSPKYQDGSGIVVINQKCVRWHGIDLEHAKDIKPDSLENHDDKRFIQSGDILWNSTGTGTIGRLAIASENEIGLTVDSHVTLVRPSRVKPKYLWCWLAGKEVYGEIENDASGSTNQIELTKTYALNLPTPLPPLAEQHRIVEKVESLFAEVDELEAKLNLQSKMDEKLQLAVNAEVQQAPDADSSKSAWTFITSNFDTLYHTSEAIDNLKKNILNEVVRGRLVSQNPDDEPASELLKKIKAEKQRLYEEGEIRKPKKLPPVKEKEVPFEIPENWEWCRLGNVILETDAGKSPSCEKRPVSEDEWGVLTTTAIQENEFLEKENKVLPEKFEVQEQHIVHKDDVLITRAGPLNRTGILCHVDQVNFKLILSDKTIRLNHHLDYTYPRYTPYALNSISMRPILESYMTGMAKSQVNISQTNIKKLIFPLPPLEEQHRIVRRIEELFTICDRFKAQLQQREKVNERLVKGLVDKVLEGS